MSRRRSLAVAFVVAAAVVVCAAIGAAHALNNPKITITVVALEDGQPIKDAPVTILKAGEGMKPIPNSSVYKNTTNKKGEVICVFAPSGDYVVEVDVPGKQIVKAAVKMRDQQRRKINLPSGKVLEDREGLLDPNNPVMPVSIPSDANTVELRLFVGKPTGQAGAAGPGGVDVQDRELKEKLRAAVAAIQAGQFEAGLGEVDKLLAKRAEAKPADVATMLYMRGFCLYKLNRADEVEAPLKEAIQLNPKFDSAMDLLASFYIGRKQFPEAAATMQERLPLATEPAQRSPLLLNLALALREQKKDAEALPLLEEAYKLTPSDPAIIVQLADAYSAAGRADDADKLVASAPLSPADAGVLNFNVAAALMRSKQWAAAEQHFRKALELKPDLADAHKYLAEALLNQDKREDALAELQAYVAAAPNAPDAESEKQVIDALQRDLKAQAAQKQKEQQKQQPKPKK